MTKECIYCGTKLIPAWNGMHWRFCPRCEPEWSTHNALMARLVFNDAYATSVAADERGRPTIGGVKK